MNDYNADELSGSLVYSTTGASQGKEKKDAHLTDL